MIRGLQFRFTGPWLRKVHGFHSGLRLLAGVWRLLIKKVGPGCRMCNTDTAAECSSPERNTVSRYPVVPACSALFSSLPSCRSYRNEPKAIRNFRSRESRHAYPATHPATAVLFRPIGRLLTSGVCSLLFYISCLGLLRAHPNGSAFASRFS